MIPELWSDARRCGMPWKESRILDQRLQFRSSYRMEEMSVSDLCCEFGVSRPMGYRWINRYEEVGPEGLLDLSQKPHGYSHAMPAATESQSRLAQQVSVMGSTQAQGRLEKLEPGTESPAPARSGNILTMPASPARLCQIVCRMDLARCERCATQQCASNRSTSPLIANMERLLDVQTPVDTIVNALARYTLWAAAAFFFVSLACRYGLDGIPQPTAQAQGVSGDLSTNA
jgi:hypothetical protein